MAENHEPQCCHIGDSDARCVNKSEFWVGRDGVDDCTYCCAGHLQETRELFSPDGRAISMKLLRGEK